AGIAGEFRQRLVLADRWAASLLVRGQCGIDPERYRYSLAALKPPLASATAGLSAIWPGVHQHHADAVSMPLQLGRCAVPGLSQMASLAGLYGFPGRTLRPLRHAIPSF